MYRYTFSTCGVCKRLENGMNQGQEHMEHACIDLQFFNFVVTLTLDTLSRITDAE